MVTAKANDETKTKTWESAQLLSFSGAVAVVTTGLRRTFHMIQTPQRSFQQCLIPFFIDSAGGLDGGSLLP